ncbi:pre-mRNA-splicing factor 38B [Phlebotomus papatasi]|uniref:pre-mRNA-splicing factor 38B n=1 Tax=Phlebotomus papatasi TaxID=29031 RepID=UPI0024834E01|nr:pre-mRNA-splicing factor 38B [Phlebotomus papatasi]
MDYTNTEDPSDHSSPSKKMGKFHNVLPLWGNEASMNLNPLILANIQSSSYFKVTLFKLKTYHEVVDEIFYQVKHLEPWEKGSRKTAGQTGMCGGVRGVGAGGIVSSAFCLLYKLYTLKLTRKQVNGLLAHTDSPYIRALGFMYIRYTQPPGDLFDWYEQYLQDEEEIDVKAGGGQVITIGQMLVQWLTKLDWFSTLFPRIPVPIQKQIETKLNEYAQDYGITLQPVRFTGNNSNAGGERYERGGGGDRSRDDYQGRRRDEPQSRERDSYRRKYDDRDRDRESHRNETRTRSRSRDRDKYRDRGEATSSRDRYRERERERSRSSERYRSQKRHRGSERERSDRRYR